MAFKRVSLQASESFKSARRSSSILMKEKLDIDNLKRKTEKELKIKLVSNFFVGDESYMFENYSFGYLSHTNEFRIFVVKIIVHSYFENLILAAIGFNSILYGISDYSHVDSGGNLSSDGSLLNYIVSIFDFPLLMVFTLEMILKIIGMGFYGNRGSYLSNFWNWLDFLVVITGLASELDTSGKSLAMSMIRTFRFLRPLRSISSMPGLRNIVTAIVSSIPQIGGVALLLGFIFVFFAIFGVQVFSGPWLHSVCRLTPYPVTNDWVYGSDPSLFRCLDESTFSLKDDASYTKETSPWRTPRNCFWPIHEGGPNSVSRYCSLDGGAMNVCYNEVEFLQQSEWTWCGSNFDALGNPRFIGMSKDFNKDSATYKFDLNFGYTTFDDFPSAFMTIFQVITGEGWSAIMYFVQDSYGINSGTTYFLVLLISGMFFVLQLMLAVLEENFNKSSSLAPEKTNDLYDGDSVIDYDEEIENSNSKEDIPIDNDSTNKVSDLETGLQNKNIINNDDLIKNNNNKSNAENLVIMEGKNKRMIYRIISLYGDLKLFLSIVVVSNTFEAISAIFISINTVTLMMDSYPISSPKLYLLEAFNAVLSLIFMLEMILKLIGLGFKKYFTDPVLLFDGFIVLMSVIELGLDPPPLLGGDSHESSKSGVISVLRCFRLFRIIKLATKFKKVKLLLARIVQSFIDLGSFIILLLLFLFISTLFGMQCFANTFHFDESGNAITLINSDSWLSASEISRYNFDNFSNSFASSFQIMTTENWNTILYDIYRAKGFIYLAYPCVIIILGTYLLMNLFLVILLANFASETLEAEVDKQNIPSFEKLREDDVKNNENNNVDGEQEDNGIELGVHDKERDLDCDINKFKMPDTLVDINVLKVIPIHSPNKVVPIVTSVMSTPLQSDRDRESVHSTPNSKSKGDYDIVSTSFTVDILSLNTSKISESKIDKEKENSPILTNSNSIESLNDTADDSYYIIPEDHKIRQFATTLISHDYFDNSVLVLIIISSISLAIDNPLIDPNSDLKYILTILDLIMTFLFFSEMLLKILSTGFIFQKKAYLKNGWNILDFIIVLISLVTLFGTGDNQFRIFKSLRTFRALRPLRMISRAPGMKVLVNAVIFAVPDVLNVLVVVILFFSIFAIMSVSFLKGDLRQCSGIVYDDYITADTAKLNLLQHPQPWNEMSTMQQSWFEPNSVFNSTSSSQWDCASYTSPTSSWEISCCPFIENIEEITSRSLCECWGGEWTQVVSQVFDNYQYSLMAFWEISTTEGWVDLMYAAVDSNGIDMQPIYGNNAAYIYYFILFIVAGNFFALNLFIGVLIDNFNRLQKSSDSKDIFTTDGQQEWVQAQSIAMQIKPKVKAPRPLNRHLGILFDVVSSRFFDSIILLFILLNSIVLAVQYWGQSTEYDVILDNINTIFAIIFTIEAIMKISAKGWFYFRNRWNQFDFLVVTGSIISAILYFGFDVSAGMIITVVRIFRVFRIVRLVKGSEKIKQLMDAVVFTLPGLVNITCLLLFFFIYAILGVQLFAKVEYFGTYNEHANFRSMGVAMLSLVRFCTGEGWPLFMYDTIFPRSDCVDDPVYNDDYCGFNNKPGCIPLNGCGSNLIYPYLMSFTLFITVCLFNLFIGIVIDGFQEANDSKKTIKPDEFISFSNQWATFDQNASGFISMKDLGNLVLSMETPLGFLNDFETTDKEILDTLIFLDIYIYNGKYARFDEVLRALTSEAIIRKRIAENKHDFRKQNSINSKDLFKRDDSKKKGISLTNSFDGGYFKACHYFAAVKLQEANGRRVQTQLAMKLVEEKREIRDISIST
jgi:hypothetical protein